MSMLNKNRMKRPVDNESGQDADEKLMKQLRRDAFIKISVSAATMLVIFTFVVGIAFAPTNDMFPVIHEGDLIIYFRTGTLVNTDVVIY